MIVYREAQQYIAAYRKNLKDGPGPVLETAVKIALLSSSTLDGIKEILSVQCWEEGLEPQVYVAPYGQYSQEILTPAGGLYAFAPDIVFLSIDLRSVSGGLYFDPYAGNAGDRRAWVAALAGQFEALATAFRRNSPALLVVHGMEVPVYSALGILESKEDFGFVAAVRDLNARIESLCRSLTGVYFFDHDLFLSRIGKESAFDPRFYYLGDMQLGMKALPRLGEAYLAFIRPSASRFTKCIVLDLDNTLWGGIIGEDGPGGIHLGPTPEGRPYWEFQQSLLALFRRGVALAVNSRNNPADALQVLREHPFMVLKEEHFAALEINWEDKASNLQRIARTLNIGLDAVIYIDDDPMNCALVRSAFPAVNVQQVPEDPAGLRDLLHGLKGLDLLQLTGEDRAKGRLFSEESRRREFLSASASTDDFFQQLGLAVRVSRADDLSFPRIAQLTQKTNQFNLTTRRRQENELRALAGGREWRIEAFAVKDKFGDNGLVGVTITRELARRWHVDTFLLSCRVIGRRVERAMLARLIAKARDCGIEEVIGEYIPTQKNGLAQPFYTDAGFEFLESTDNAQYWVFDTARDLPVPAFVQLIEG